jgi:hypothetical protein
LAKTIPKIKLVIIEKIRAKGLIFTSAEE